jgi:hypothetical protein
MSDKPEGTGQPEEVTSLNADDLDVTELEDKLLEHAAGGMAAQEEASLCWDFTCGSNSSAA